MSTERRFLKLSEAQRPFFAGVDLGGTNIKVGVVDDLGRPLSWLSIKTDAVRGPEDATRRMAAALEQAAQQASLGSTQELAYVGLGSPGTMDIAQGMLLEPPNLPGWNDFPIVSRLAHHCGRPVAFSNDAGAAALGEFWVGTGREHASLVMFTLGTGVGGGIILHEESIEGEHSHGAELGHIIIDWSSRARVCSCGQGGHLEAYASATAVIQRTQEALDSGRPSSLRARLAAGATLSPLLLAEEANQGDALSDELIMETAMYLGIGAVTLMHTIDPACVVIGGAMTFGGNNAPLGRRFLDRIRAEVRQRAFPVPAAKTTIEFASLGGDAGYIGAAGVARQAWRKRG